MGSAPAEVELRRWTTAASWMLALLLVPLQVLTVQRSAESPRMDRCRIRPSRVSLAFTAIATPSV